MKAYQLINKETDVVEIETTILPEALSMIGGFQAKLDEWRDLAIATETALAEFDEGSNVESITKH